MVKNGSTRFTVFRIVTKIVSTVNAEVVGFLAEPPTDFYAWPTAPVTVSEV